MATPVEETGSSKPFARLVAGGQNQAATPPAKPTGVKRPMALQVRKVVQEGPTETELKRAEIAAAVLEAAKLQTTIQGWVPSVLDAKSVVDAAKERAKNASFANRAVASAERDDVLAMYPNIEEVLADLYMYMWEAPTDTRDGRAARRGAWKGFLLYWLRKPNSMRDLRGHILELVEQDELKEAENGKGQLRNGGEWFNVPKEACLDEVDVEELQRAVDETRNRISRQEKQAGDELLAADNNISIKETLDNKWGTGALFVPAHEIVFPDGKQAWRSQGVLAYASDGKGRVYVSEGTGGLRGIAATMESHKTFLTIERLSAAIQAGKPDDDKSLTGYLLKIMVLGILNERGQEQQTALLDEFRAKADVTANKWFLDGATGEVCAEHRGKPWELPGGEFIRGNVYFRLKRTIEGEKSFVEMTEVPAHLQQHLPSPGQKYEEGQALDGLTRHEDPKVKTLGVMLRAIHGQIQRAAKRPY